MHGYQSFTPYNAGNDCSAAPTDDYSNTDDSGFVDSKEFLKDHQQQTLRPPNLSSSNPGYAKLTKATLETPDCHTYQTLDPGNSIVIVLGLSVYILIFFHYRSCLRL